MCQCDPKQKSVIKQNCQNQSMHPYSTETFNDWMVLIDYTIFCFKKEDCLHYYS